MKNVIVLMAMIASSIASAGETGRSATEAEKRNVLHAVMTDVMLRGALDEARKTGKCEGLVISAANNGPAGIEFEAQVSCSAPADEYTGGGTILMINIKGRVFGDSLENSVITVQKAG